MDQRPPPEPTPTPEPSSADKVARDLLDSIKAQNLGVLNLPDHEVRSARWYQLYNRLARPTLDWVCVGGTFYMLILGPIIGKAVTEGYLTISLAFIGGNIGARVVEKVKGLN